MSLRKFVMLVLALLLASTVFAATPIRVLVDATDAPRNVFRSHITLPAHEGMTRLAVAKWIPGEHGPTGPVTDVVDVRITANGAPLTWRRDPLEMFVVETNVPAKASTIDVDLTYLAPTASGQFTAGQSSTANLAVMSWNTLLVFTPGTPADDVTVEGAIRMPEGWTWASPLLAANEANGRVDFQPASLTTYVDSPVLISRFLKKVTLDTPNAPPHRINIASESNAALITPPNFVADYSRLVAEAGSLFGAYHFRKYDWLLTLSDHVAHFGLEHHEASDDRMAEATLSKENLRRRLGGLLSHEYVHSWNGKFRRPAGLLSADYMTPMQGEMLWVYEGLTQYLGEVLAARSGLWTPEYYRESVARIAATFDQQPGRTWRPLADTAVAAQLLYAAPEAWSSLRRSTDFYDESVLLWLEVDSIIRAKTNGKATLDDFVKRFHGAPGGKPEVKPYTFDDVVNALNAVAPYDWRTHLNERLWSTSPRAPIGGITGHGWRLVYDETPNAVASDDAEMREQQDATFTLGMTIKNADGSIVDVTPGLPAASAGLAPGMKVVAVNGRRWTREVLDAAIREAKGGNAPIEIIAENNDFFRTYAVNYHEGMRYPHLVRDEKTPDTLGDVVRAHSR
ncbi:MAG TPA: M61 family peptidase [Thermoanaerobaculia bacterium]|nr:M61 family peptidase [Thermoanaerobaculia bacterium]